MKPLKTLTKLSSEIDKMPESPEKALINSLIKDINTEYQKRTLRLLKQLALGENLDFNVLKEQYTKKSKIQTQPLIDSEVNEELMLTKILVENVHYFVEMIPNGKVYNTSSKLIGTWVNDKIILN